MSEEDLSYEELKQQVEELQYGIETLDDDLDMKTRENEQLQEELKKRNEEINSLKEKLEKSEKEKGRMEDLVEIKHKESLSIQSKINDICKEIDMDMDLNNSPISLLDSVRQKFMDSNLKVKEIMQKCDLLEKENKSIQQKLEEVQ